MIVFELVNDNLATHKYINHPINLEDKNHEPQKVWIFNTLYDHNINLWIKYPMNSISNSKDIFFLSHNIRG